MLAGHDLRAAEDDDRRIDVMLAEQRFGLEQFELHPQRAIFLAAEEVDVDFGELVAGRLEDRQPVGGDLFGDGRRLQRFGPLERQLGVAFECVGIDAGADLARGIFDRWSGSR